MLLIEAALPVASRYGVTVCCSGNCTVTFGGGGAMKVFFSPHAVSSISSAAPAMPARPTRKLCSPADPADLICSMSPRPTPATVVARDMTEGLSSKRPVRRLRRVDIFTPANSWPKPDKMTRIARVGGATAGQPAQSAFRICCEKRCGLLNRHTRLDPLRLLYGNVHEHAGSGDRRDARG